jgi:hypothetical protein
MCCADHVIVPACRRRSARSRRCRTRRSWGNASGAAPVPPTMNRDVLNSVPAYVSVQGAYAALSGIDTLPPKWFK